MEEVVALGAPVQILPSRPNSWLCASRKTRMPKGFSRQRKYRKAISNPAPTKTTAQNRNTERQSQTPAPTKTTAQNSNAGGESQRDTPRGKPSDLNSPAYKWKGS